MPVQKDSMDWEDLRYFLALVEHASLSAAARRLRTTHATVARRINRLERQLDVQLFERSRSGYRLTQSGEAILKDVRPMGAATMAIASTAAAEKSRLPTVRLSLPRTMGDRFVVPRIAARVRALGVNLSLSMESKIVSLAQFEADIAIRLARPKNSELVGRRVATIDYALYGRPEFRNEPNPPVVATSEDDRADEWTWFRRHYPKAVVVLSANSQVAQLAAVEAGAGIGLLPRYIVADGSDLTEFPSKGTPPSRPAWLLARKASLRNKTIRQVYDALAQIFHEQW